MEANKALNLMDHAAEVRSNNTLPAVVPTATQLALPTCPPPPPPAQRVPQNGSDDKNA